jgi:MSHA biogenesis protein MshO
MHPTAQRGMTLIELVVVITLSAIVVAFMSMLIVTPIDAFTAQKQRAQLADAADGALRMLSRDLRAALPNSVRTYNGSTVSVIEMLATVDGARYQDNGPLGNSALWLDFSQADGAFSTTVPFSEVPGTLPYSYPTSFYLAIYNIGIAGADAYAYGANASATPNVITPAGTTITISAGATANAQLVTLSSPFQFALGSPEKRVYVVSGPVSYLCDKSTGLLTRYAGYSLLATQPTSAAALIGAGATSSGVVATNVSTCTFTYTPGTSSQRGGLATLWLQMASNGQQVQLVEQAHLVNAP